MLVGNVQGARQTVTDAAGRAWHSIFGDRPQAEVGSRTIVVLSSPSLADRMEAASGKVGAAKQRQWVADIEAEQDAFLASLRERGVTIEREQIFTKTLNGFSATLDARAVAELDRNPSVIGVYPVRAVYPAEAEALRAPAVGAQAGVSLPGFDGQGTKVALLDTGVDAEQAALANRLRRGFDVVGGDRKPLPEADPSGEGRIEAHGTRMAGLVAAVAPGAKIVPIRVVGWQQGKDGSFALTGRGDQLIAGLERAVDPNGDGAVTDGATVALAPLVEPFAAFTDSPESRAVEGATRLGTLVVASAGNDGSSGVGFGSIGAPGRSRGCAHRGRRRLAHPGRGGERLGPRGRGHDLRAAGSHPRQDDAFRGGDPGRRGPPRPLALEPDASGGGRVRRFDARRFLRHEGREPGRRASRARPCRRELARSQGAERQGGRSGGAARLRNGSAGRRARRRPGDGTPDSRPAPGRPGRTRWTHSARADRCPLSLPPPARSSTRDSTPSLGSPPEDFRSTGA